MGLSDCWKVIPGPTKDARAAYRGRVSATLPARQVYHTPLFVPAAVVSRAHHRNDVLSFKHTFTATLCFSIGTVIQKVALKCRLRVRERTTGKRELSAPRDREMKARDAYDLLITGLSLPSDHPLLAILTSCGNLEEYGPELC